MIPCALPKLMTDAVRNGWDVHVIPASNRDRSMRLSCHHGKTVVYILWLPDGPGGAWRYFRASINAQPTPYPQ